MIYEAKYFVGFSFLDTTMAKLVFSKGLLIEQDPKGFCISHDDDIVIEANIQLPLRMLKSKKASIFINQLMLLKYLRIKIYTYKFLFNTHRLQARNIFFNNLPQKAFVGEDVFLCKEFQKQMVLQLMVICFTNTSLQYKSTLQGRS